MLKVITSHLSAPRLRLFRGLWRVGGTAGLFSLRAHTWGIGDRRAVPQGIESPTNTWSNVIAGFEFSSSWYQRGLWMQEREDGLRHYLEGNQCWCSGTESQSCPLMTTYRLAGLCTWCPWWWLTASVGVPSKLASPYMCTAWYDHAAAGSRAIDRPHCLKSSTSYS